MTRRSTSMGVAAMLSFTLLLTGCSSGQSVSAACDLVRDANLAGRLAASTTRSTPEEAATDYQSLGTELAALQDAVNNSEIAAALETFSAEFNGFMSKFESTVTAPANADLTDLASAANNLAEAGKALASSCSDVVE